MFSIFSRSKQARPLLADMHAHWIPGVDDGVKTPEEAREVIDGLRNLGYRKLIATPHIMSDFYANTAEGLRASFDQFQGELRMQGEPIELQLAAEYYLDEATMSLVTSDAPLLTFGSPPYLLFETNMISEPLHLKEFIFRVASRGITPILAHPERYQYMSIGKAEDLRNRGVMLQINILSLIGYYGPPAEKMAGKLIERGWLEFIGSDCHNPSHLPLLEEAYKSRWYKKAADLPLLNYTL